MFTTPTLYVKGTFNGWGLDTPFSQINDNQFQAELILTADIHKFKITNMDGTKDWTFSAHAIEPTPIQLNESYQLIKAQGVGNDLVFTPTATSRFSLLLDLTDTPSLRIYQKEGFAKSTQKRSLFQQSIHTSSNEITEIAPIKNLLCAQALFEQLAIENKNAFSFVFGDSVDGYYEGKTHCFHHSGKYRHHQGWYLGSFASLFNDELHDKSLATKATLQAYGIEHEYETGAKDTLSLFSGKRIVSLNTLSVEEGMLAFIPELNIGLNDCFIEIVENCALISIKPRLCPEGAPRFIAISANQNFIIQEIDIEANTNLASTLAFSPNNLQLKIQSKQTTTSFTAYFAFEHDRKTALANAQHAAKNHGELLHKKDLYAYLAKNYLWTNDIEYNRALMWARIASRSLVNKEFGTGIWAGLPWFKDCWGRDTFIALPGTSLINGQWQDAKAIISDFAKMQMVNVDNIHYGRIPNRVTSKTNIIYNTTDGTPWMIKEIMEYINYSGDFAFAKQIYPVVKRFIQGVEKYYLDSDGLMLHRDPDTWMDAKINGEIPWSPRGPKANDIQVLWYESLNVTHQLALWNDEQDFAHHCLTLAEKVQKSFIEKFWHEEKGSLADHLSAQDKADHSVRPNQLMVLTIPATKSLLSKSIGQHLVKNAVDKLLFPWGICSLQQEHEDFHPFHDNRLEYHKDAAYHNGAIWGWNAGFTVSSLVQFEKQELAYQLSKNLAKQILNQGHRGTMSENLDAFQYDADALIESGTYSQAWSVSEFARNAQQDYLGFNPKLAKNTIQLNPKLPKSWANFVAYLPFGDNALTIKMQRENDSISFDIQADKPDEKINLELKLSNKDRSFTLLQTLATAQRICLNENTNEIHYSNKRILVLDKKKEHFTLLDDLNFAKPNFKGQYAALNQPNYLMEKRLEEKLAIATD